MQSFKFVSNSDVLLTGEYDLVGVVLLLSESNVSALALATARSAASSISSFSAADKSGAGDLARYVGYVL